MASLSDRRPGMEGKVPDGALQEDSGTEGVGLEGTESPLDACCVLWILFLLAVRLGFVWCEAALARFVGDGAHVFRSHESWLGGVFASWSHAGELSRWSRRG